MKTPGQLPDLSMADEKESLLKAEFDALLENTASHIWAVDRAHRLLGFNQAFAEFIQIYAGMSVERGMEIERFLEPQNHAHWNEMLKRALTQGAFQTEIMAFDGSTFAVAFRPILLHGKVAGVSVFAQDISERSRYLNSLQEAEKQYHGIFDAAPAGILQSTPEGVCRAINLAGARMYGFESAHECMEAMNRQEFSPWFRIEDRQKGIERIEHEGLVQDYRVRFRRRNGDARWASVAARRVAGEDGETAYYEWFIEDITEKRQLGVHLRSRLRDLRLASEMNNALLQAKDEQQLLAAYCRIVVEVGGYKMAYVLFTDDAPSHPLIPVASAGDDSGFLARAQICWDKRSKFGNGLVGNAVRSGKVQICEEIATDPRMEAWRDEMRNLGMNALIVVPFPLASGATGVLAAYSLNSRSVSEFESQQMQQFARQLGYGVDTLRVAAAQRKYQVELNAGLEQIIEVIAETIDRRDPYTAGHQRRVAALCCRIGQELDLDEERMQGLRLAARIHDLGKIGIPAELLSFPGSLRPSQISLLREHPQIGYEIVRNVQFPWPIADMILQHHERLDGSGYPQGLREEQILLEARILAVADVVEAMSSHRPYRASLGIEQALEEVRAQRGIKYDARVVDVCLRLFDEENYQIP